MQHDIPARETEKSPEQDGKPFDKAAYLAALPLNLRRNIVHERDKRLSDSIYESFKDPRWRKDRQDLFTRYLANLRIADEHCIPARYSRDANYYSGKKFGYRQIVSVLDQMVEVGLIQQALGHFNRDNDWNVGDQTRIWATPKLLELYAEINPDEIVLEPPELVQIHKRQAYLQKVRGEKPVHIPVPRNRKVRNMIYQLERYGCLLGNSSITLSRPAGPISFKALNNMIEVFANYNYDRLKVLKPGKAAQVKPGHELLGVLQHTEKTENQPFQPGQWDSGTVERGSLGGDPLPVGPGESMAGGEWDRGRVEYHILIT